MPVFMQYSGVDGDVSGPPADGGTRDAGNFATGETLVHVEAPSTTPIAGDLIFGAGGHSDVEVMIKVLDGRPAHATGETLVHVEPGWLMA